jgi:hypothetical protein
VSTRNLRGAIVAAAAARLAYAALCRNPPGGAPAWTRTNHRGEAIILLEGPAVAFGAVAGALAAGGSGRERLAQAVAGAGAAAFGAYDDLAGSGGSRGFRGHLGALRRGEVTTGAVKIAGIGATGFAAAVIARQAARQGPVGLGSARRGIGGAGQAVSAVLTAADVVINTGLVAGGANLLNLFDLRPGRASKVAVAAGALIAAGAGEAAPASAAPVAAALALLREDLGERSMLGDSGANALGAMLGTVAATSLSRPRRLAALGAVAGLTVASEYVSFTKVIERTAALHWLDMLGRRPAGPSAAAAATPAGSPRVGTVPGADTAPGAVPAANAVPAADSIAVADAVPAQAEDRKATGAAGTRPR